MVVGGVAMTTASDHLYIIHQQHVGADYDRTQSTFTLQARAVSKPRSLAWAKNITALPGVRLEAHAPLWHLAADGDSLYLLTNSTMKGRSRILFRLDASGDIVASAPLDRYIFQRSIHPTAHGLIAAFHARVVLLDATDFGVLATWNHPSPTRWNTYSGMMGEIVAVGVDDQHAFVLEFTQSPRGPAPEDESERLAGISDDVQGITSMVRLSLTSPMLGEATSLAVLGTTSTRNRYKPIKASGEGLVVTEDLVIATMINEAGGWNLCEIPKVAEPTATCAELAHAAHVDARETALTGMPGGGYLWGIPSEDGVVVGIHAAETTVRTLKIQEGTATAVRLAASEKWIFALVDVVSEAGDDARHFMELHRMSL